MILAAKISRTAMDILSIVNLRCTAHIGCKPEERALPQALIITVNLTLDTRPAAAADDLNLTVNYAHLSKALIRACEESQCQLIETLAENLAARCLKTSPRIQAVNLIIKKPAGVPNGDYAALEITRP